ncbi:hypothetical protein DTL42_18420 [Bremerella cremea]|uniref:Uncharacterized protein n=1 Tax=Bremerella cremea TaxID=1031537 RepID=A0A368KMN3_9BACT|nr:hypothetical protein [Bremerella cremea]RCS43962.1 hypothetical protein DTL42_18420 [Bremerella cremea]
MKSSQIIWIAALALFATWMLMDKSVEIIHGPQPEPTPARREGLLRSFVRALAHWGLDRAFQKKPPEEPDPDDFHQASLAEPVLSLQAPPTLPSEFLIHEGDAINHHAGW